jgi:lactoylglutathione lyase
MQRAAAPSILDGAGIGPRSMQLANGAGRLLAMREPTARPPSRTQGKRLYPPARDSRVERRRQGVHSMRYLHTMLRVRDLDAALNFYVNLLGMKEVRRYSDEKGRFTNVFLGAPHDEDLVAATGKNGGRHAPVLELTYNWDPEDYGEARHFGHLAFEVDDIYALCDKLMKAGITINRPPREGRMAFVRSPDKQSVELLQKGDALPPAEPWKSMPNTGRW